MDNYVQLNFVVSQQYICQSLHFVNQINSPIIDRMLSSLEVNQTPPISIFYFCAVIDKSNY